MSADEVPPSLEMRIKFSLLAADARRRRAKAKGVMFDHFWDAEGEQLRQANYHWQCFCQETSAPNQSVAS